MPYATAISGLRAGRSVGAGGARRRQGRAHGPEHRTVAVTVRDIMVPAPVRLAQALVGAAIVRDVAAFAALVVLFTMFAVLSGFDPMV